MFQFHKPIIFMKSARKVVQFSTRAQKAHIWSWLDIDLGMLDKHIPFKGSN